MRYIISPGHHKTLAENWKRIIWSIKLASKPWLSSLAKKWSDMEFSFKQMCIKMTLILLSLHYRHPDFNGCLGSLFYVKSSQYHCSYFVSGTCVCAFWCISIQIWYKIYSRSHLMFPQACMPALLQLANVLQTLCWSSPILWFLEAKAPSQYKDHLSQVWGCPC